ncbi:MAG TPA: GDSL-type esterase/lipase family protein [Kofleriaceae bacterium]|nr:GDSL-type esterase/lipase family protein [Kofleriaceae bacterium]
MSARDRSWTVAPAFLWFGGCLIAALWALDGGVSALADRFTAPREASATPAAGPGPSFTAKPAAADAEADDDARPAAPAPIVAADRSKILALEDTCLDGAPPACKQWAMDGFYRAVADSKQHKLGHPVRVSWYGDSVIATDAIPGRLRTLLQTELGDGGPGYVFAVPPHRFCGHEAIVRSSGGSWQSHAISTMQAPDGLYGVGGGTAETEDGRVAIKLINGAVTHAELYYLAQPHGGTATLSADGKPIATVDTKGTAKQAGYAAAAIEGGGKKFEIATSGRVRLFGLDLENDTGAVVDNLGVVSVNVKSFDANNAEHFADELAHRSADLVMIMIGANEAEWLRPTDRDTKDYAAHYGKLLATVRKARPDAACLVVSPTDQAEALDGDYPSRPVMPVLVAAQRAAAHAAGCAFYSTYDWMGGKGSAVKWFRKGLVGTDFQHLSRKGANRLSEALYGTLMAGYQKYAAH